MIENRNLLGIPLDVPEPPPVPRKRVPQSQRERPPSSGRQTGSDSDPRHSRQGSAQSQMGLPEMFARGLIERGESLGINKTFMNAVSELKVSELQSV